MRNLRAILLVIASLVSSSAGAHVFIRWTEPLIPPAMSLGVRDLVITWTAPDNALLHAARQQGYRVYAEVTPAQAAAAARANKRDGLAGIIVAAPGTGPVPEDLNPRAGAGSVDALIKRLRTAYPALVVRLLEPGGKQPQMKGTLVVGKDGVLEVSSPTQQPWIDSNIALIRFERVYHPDETPLVDFKWSLTDPTEQRYGPPSEDYELAIAEAASFHADLILPLHKNLQKDLAQGKPQGRTVWRGIRRYMRFYERMPSTRPHLLTNVGVITNDYDASYEGINLMARHNIPFDVIMPGALASGRLKDMALIVVFGPLDGGSAQTVDRFAQNGGTAVLVGQPGKYPWSSLRPVSKNEDAAVYLTGKGKVVEIAGPITDPESFARDIWRLLSGPERELSLWNALTTLAATYRVDGDSAVRLNLVNYSGNPIRVQARVKGAYSEILYETPERGGSVSLKPVEKDGFTEFVVPEFRVGARVYLSGTGARQPHLPSKRN